MPKKTVRISLSLLALISLILILHPTPHAAPTPAPTPAPPPPIIAVTTYGGIGNQLYFLAEALALARATNATLIVPSLPPRNFNSSLSHAEQPGSTILDLRLLSTAAPITATLPPQCAAGFSKLLIARRGGRPLPPNSRVYQVACFLSPRRNMSVRKCGERMLRGARVLQYYMPLAERPGGGLREEVRKGGCVLVDGHSFAYKGIRAHEYLYSMLRFVRAPDTVRRLVRDVVRDARLANVAVLHLRFDEHECRQVRANAVCLRRSLRAGDISWTSTSAFISALIRSFPSEISHIYLALSPYTPASVGKSLRRGLSARLAVLPAAEGVVKGGHVVVNLVERQLAMQAGWFVGDFGSTWSGTVYYKRRIAGRGSKWSCRVVGECANLGYYEREGALGGGDFERDFERDVVVV